MHAANNITILRRYSLIVLMLCFAIVSGCSKESSSHKDKDALVKSDFCSCNKNEGSFYSYAGGIIEAAGKTLGMELENIETSNSLENAGLIAQGECSMGLVREDTFRYLLDGSRLQNNESTITASRLRVIMTAYSEDVHLLININNVTDIDGDGWLTPGDLEGKKISAGTENSDTYVTATYVLASYGLDGSNCTIDNTAPEDAIGKVVSGELDAMFVVSSLPYAPFTDAALKGAPVSLITCCMKEDVNSGMYADDGIIHYSIYPFQTYTVENNLQVKSLLAVSDEFDGSGLDDFYDYLIENKEDFADEYDDSWSSFGLSYSDSFLSQNPVIWDHHAAETISGYDYDISNYSFYPEASLEEHDNTAADIIPFIEPYFGYSLTAADSTGSGQNAIAMLRGSAVMAVIQDDVFEYLRNSDDSYEGMKAVKMRKIMPLYNEDVYVLVNRTSGINEISDLQGKKVSLCEKTSGSFISGINIINSYGFDPGNAPTYYFANPEDSINGVADGDYDAAVLVSPRPSSLLLGLTAEQSANVKLIPAVAGTGYSYDYIAGTIPQSTYPLLLDDDITNAQVTALLVLNSGADDSPVPGFIGRLYSEMESGTLAAKLYWAGVAPESGLAYFRRNPYGWSGAAAGYFIDRLSE